MLWKILRPHYWILDRSIRTTRTVFIIAPLVLLIFSGEWLYNNVVREWLVLFNSEEAVTAVATFLPTGLFIILVFTILGFGDVLHQLYVAADVELLLTAPISVSMLFWYKLIQCSRSSLISALGLGLFLAIFGLARNAPAGYFVLVGVLILLLVVLATAVVMMLAIALARWLPTQRIRYWIPILVTFLTFGLLLMQQSATQWFLGQEGLIRLFTEGLFNLQKLSLTLLALGGLTLLLSLSTFWIFSAHFHESWNRYRLVPSGQTAVFTTRRRLPLSDRVTAWLPLSWRASLRKEWLELWRNPRGLLNLMQPLVLVAAMLVLFWGAREKSILLPLSFYALLAFLGLFLITQPLGTVLLALAEEGRNIALWRSLPLSMRRVLLGKFWAAWGLAVLSWSLVLAAAGLWLGFPAEQIVVLVGTAVFGVTGAFAVTTALGGLGVNFQAEDLRQRTSPITNYLTMGMNAIFVSLTTLSALWLIVHLFPENPTTLVLKGLASFSVVRWVFSENLDVPFALVGGQGLFWLGVGWLWRAATHRLEGLEIV